MTLTLSFHRLSAPALLFLVQSFEPGGFVATGMAAVGKHSLELVRSCCYLRAAGTRDVGSKQVTGYGNCRYSKLGLLVGMVSA